MTAFFLDPWLNKCAPLQEGGIYDQGERHSQFTNRDSRCLTSQLGSMTMRHRGERNALAARQRRERRELERRIEAGRR